MGFLIPLGIKINFLFYPWSAQSRTGLQLPAWEKICSLRYTTMYQAKLMYGKWLLLHLPSTSHLHTDAFHWQHGKKSQKNVRTRFLWVSRGTDKEEARKRVRHVTYANLSRVNLDGSQLLWTRREVHRGERRGRELSDPGHTTTRLSTVPLLHFYLTWRCDAPNIAGLKANYNQTMWSGPHS